MRIGVCGIACEKCPRMQKLMARRRFSNRLPSGTCPNGQKGCVPRENKFCKVCACAFRKGVKLCFECPEFPCETTRQGPVSYGYCQFLAGKE